MEPAKASEFDREASFGEVFRTREAGEFLRWLCELMGAEMLVSGREGEAIAVPAESPHLLSLPRPPANQLPRSPTRFKSAEGGSAIGVPVSYEGDTFAMLVLPEAAAERPEVRDKLPLLASLLEWYITVVHQRRMISELHDHTQTLSYQDLLVEHQAVVESEKKYRELSETLEQRVEERKRELEKAQRQLLQQEKMASVGQLAAGVAHEINNPTGFVHSNLQTLRDYHAVLGEALARSKALLSAGPVAGAEEFFEKWKEADLDYILKDLPPLVEQSLKGTERIIKIVKGLSRFSRSDQEQMEPVNVNELLDSTVELLWNEIKHKAKLTKRFTEVPPVMGNPNQLGQVFVNMIVNALQSMEKGGALSISTAAADSRVEVRIKDTGHGIPAENLAQIFNPFFTTKPVGQGTGLGLSISYEIIQAHGGEIVVESEVGKGTTFVIRLPTEKVKSKK